MFTVGSLLVGLAAAYIVGVSKTGVPGAAILAVPMFATIVDGRLIPGATLPILIVADLFAVAWYRTHTRWDLLRPLAWWIGAGYVCGIGFFVAVGAATRSLEIVIGGIVLAVIGIQAWRMFRGAPAREADTATAAVYGTAGGFMTFVANAAGPVINTYLAGLGLGKRAFLGTSAWLYFALNISKIPFYVALGELTDGGRFFTLDSLAFDALMVPAVVVGVYSGRALVPHISQRAFLLVVLVLAAAGAVNLVI